MAKDKKAKKASKSGNTETVDATPTDETEFSVAGTKFTSDPGGSFAAILREQGDIDPAQQRMLDALASGVDASDAEIDAAARAKVASAMKETVANLDSGEAYSYVPPDTSRLPRDAERLMTEVLEHRGWMKRLGQFQMVEIINGAILESVNPWDTIDIAVNAPVGTGKTLAYLIACIAHRMRVVISTSTKGLQDQIMQEELPKLADDLMALYGFKLTFGMLKGKSNYPCLSSVNAILNGTTKDEDNNLFADFDVVPDDSDTAILKQIRARAEDAKATGNSLEFDAEHLLGSLSPDTRNAIRGSKRCAGKSLPWMEKPEGAEDGAFGDEVELGDGEYPDVPCQVAATSECIYRAAYAHNMASQIVVMNTTLLVYEIMRANSPMGGAMKPSILKGVGMVIVDEAHHLFQIISDAYSVELDFGVIKKEAADINKRLTKRYSTDAKKETFEEIERLIEHAEERCDAIIDDKDLTNTEYRQQLNEELNRLAIQVSHFVNRVTITAAKHEREHPSDQKLTQSGIPKVVAGMLYQLGELMDTVVSTAAKVNQGKREEGRKKVEHYNSLTVKGEDDLILQTVPIDVSFFREELTQSMRQDQPYAVKDDPENNRSVVTLSSGTITKNTPVVVGMRDPHYLDVESPFDPKKVRVLVPRDLPSVNAGNWLPEAWEIAAECIEVADGRTMFLTTSVRNMNEFHERAVKELGKKGFTIFKQGDMSKLELIDAFKTTKRAVLIGTRTFWEGVDVPGDPLIQVIIDKMMFPPQDDALFQARREFVSRRKPGDKSAPFMEVDVDFAAVMLAQGTGRLIRSVSDHGGIVVLDHRFVSARYSSKLTKLLPGEWSVTGDMDAYLDFMEWANPDTRKSGDDMPSPRGRDRDGNPTWFPLRKKPQGGTRNIARSA